MERDERRLAVVHVPPMDASETQAMHALHGTSATADRVMIETAGAGNIGAFAVATELLTAGRRDALAHAIAHGIVGSKLYVIGRDNDRDPERTAKALLATGSTPQGTGPSHAD